MSHKDPLAAFAKQSGFTVRTHDDVVSATGVPCLLADRSISSCVIEKSFDPRSGKPTGDIGGAVHGVRITPVESTDGRVYNADRTPVENLIGGDGKTWSNISIRKGGGGSPEDDKSARDTVHRYAKQIVGAVAAADHDGTAPLMNRGPFKILNTFEARAAIGPIQDRIREQRIAIIGLGGTGAYVLDLIAKTPVIEIHLLDSDHIDWHNFMRAPGAPSTEEIEVQRKEPPRKVDYYHSKYASLREGVHAHALRVDSSFGFAGFLSDHPIDFAFVCIDQVADTDSPRQDAVYSALSEAKVPFIDSGVSLTLDGHTVRGAVTTSAYSEGSLEWKTAIPNARVKGNLPGYRNVQLPEVNAVAASLAVMEWRRRTEQYASESTSFLHKFRLERPQVVWPG